MMPTLTVEDRILALSRTLLGVVEEIEQLVTGPAEKESIDVRWELVGGAKLAIRAGMRLEKAAKAMEASS